MNDLPRIIDEGKCETCQSWSLKVACSDRGDGNQGKCFGWQDVDPPLDETGEDPYVSPRWTKASDSCERYRLHRAMGELKAEQRLFWMLFDLGINARGKSFDQMKAMLEAAEAKA